MPLSLHRASGKPDWEQYEASDRSIIQRIAAATKGIVTPGNIVSVIGLALVVYGLILVLENNFWLGLVLIAVGRGLDVVDGVVAEATKTKSPLGEMVDAAFDKIGTLLTILVLFVGQVAAWWALTALLLPQFIIPLVILYKRKKGIGVHPTRAGKLSMALTWVGIVGLLIAKALAVPFALSLAVYVVIGVSLMLGVYALWQYARGRD